MNKLKGTTWFHAAVFLAALLALCAGSAFAFGYVTSQGQLAHDSVVSYDNARVAYLEHLDAVQTYKNVKNVDLSENGSYHAYFFYNVDSKSRISTTELGNVNGSVNYNDISGNLGSQRLYTDALATAPPNKALRLEMARATAQYVSASGQAMIDSIKYARGKLATIPQGISVQTNEYQLAQDQSLLESRTAQAQNATDPSVLKFYESLMDNNLQDAKAHVAQAIAAYSKYKLGQIEGQYASLNLSAQQQSINSSWAYGNSKYDDVATINEVSNVLGKLGY